jgi:methenyltetrahydromethanopterin cyclohydrolase
MEPLNRMALELVDEAIDFADELAIEVRELGNEATVLDFGVDAIGGVEAGLVLAELTAGGLATVRTRVDRVAGAPLTHAELATDHPALALLCSATAGWELAVDPDDEDAPRFEGLGSGPARALVAEESVFDRVGYREEFDFATLAIEAGTLPGEDVAARVAERAGVPTSGVFLPTCRTASMAGSVTAAARAAELATFRLSELGYDPLDVLSATGSAPVAPVAGDEATAMARTAGALAYGGEAHLVVEEPFDRFDEVPSSAAAEYGAPFVDILDDADWDLDALPVELFAPAQVTIDVLGGPTHVVGAVEENLLARSLGLDD